MTQYLVRLPDKEDKIPKVAAAPKSNVVEESDSDLSDDGKEDIEDKDAWMNVPNVDDGSSDGNDENPYGAEDGSDDDGNDDSADDSDGNEKVKKKKVSEDYEVKEAPADPYLIRREATLLNLVLKHFK